MKPRTKLQHKIVNLSKGLSEISEHQIEWAKNKCFPKLAHKRSKSYLCLECGQSFPIGKPNSYAKPKAVICPHCNELLKIEESLKRSWSDAQYYSIFDTAEDLQVIRHFLVKKECKAGRKAEVFFLEAVQNWITPSGQLINMSRGTAMSYYYDTWSWSSEMELRATPRYELKYNIFANFIYPRKKIIPTLRRNGFHGGLHGISPYKLLPALLTDSRAETLLKSKQYKLLKSWVRCDWRYPNKYYWSSIKICIRNNYFPSDVAIWSDYIDLLHEFGKDLRNAKYVCPADLRKEHDKLVEKKEAILLKERLEREKQKAIEEQAEFEKLKGKFFGIAFSDGEIKVVSLDSVEDYIVEGETMKHCVFTGEYYKKKKSLILSARVDDKRIETVEVSLKDFKVIQCYGKFNKPTEYHDKIIDCVNKNMNVIRSRKKRGAMSVIRKAEAV